MTEFSPSGSVSCPCLPANPEFFDTAYIPLHLSGMELFYPAKYSLLTFSEYFAKIKKILNIEFAWILCERTFSVPDSFACSFFSCFGMDAHFTILHIFPAPAAAWHARGLHFSAVILPWRCGITHCSPWFRPLLLSIFSGIGSPKQDLWTYACFPSRESCFCMAFCAGPALWLSPEQRG